MKVGEGVPGPPPRAPPPIPAARRTRRSFRDRGASEARSRVRSLFSVDHVSRTRPAARRIRRSSAESMVEGVGGSIPGAVAFRLIKSRVRSLFRSIRSCWLASVANFSVSRRRLDPGCDRPSDKTKLHTLCSRWRRGLPGRQRPVGQGEASQIVCSEASGARSRARSLFNRSRQTGGAGRGREAF